MMKGLRREVLALAALPLLLSATSPPKSLRAFAVDDAISDVSREIEDMAEVFEFTDGVPLAEGGEDDPIGANAEGVHLNRQNIATMTAKVSEDALVDAVRAIVAHEVWHYVDIKRGNLDLGKMTPAESRVYECRADLMAGRYITRKAGYEPPSDIGDSVAFTVAEMLDRKEGDRYPVKAQRSMATHVGALSVWRENISGDTEMIAQINRWTGENVGGDLGGWAQRICERLTHFGEALESIQVEEPVFSRIEGRTMLRAKYNNMSDRAVQVTTTILITADIAATPDTPDTPKSPKRWFAPAEFIIPPHSAFVIDINIVDFDGDVGLLRAVVDANAENSLISAKYVDGLPAGKLTLTASGMSPENTCFAMWLQALSNNAEQKFLDFKTGALGGARVKYYNSTVSLFGKTGIILVGNDSAYQVALFERPTRDEAWEDYVALGKNIARMWPGIKFRGDPNTDRVFSLKLNPLSRIDISFLEGQQYSVQLRVVQDQYSVSWDDRAHMQLFTRQEGSSQDRQRASVPARPQ